MVCLAIRLVLRPVLQLVPVSHQLVLGLVPCLAFQVCKVHATVPLSHQMVLGLVPCLAFQVRKVHATVPCLVLGLEHMMVLLLPTELCLEHMMVLLLPTELGLDRC